MPSFGGKAWLELSRSRDKAQHPRCPWVATNGKAISEYVAEYYRDLSVDALFLDVLSHYEKNVLPTGRGYCSFSCL